MMPATREWVEKAEGDGVTARREFRARKNPNYDAVCFHAQQCVEKYFKAWLQEKSIPFDKTHDLVRLLSLLPASETLQSLKGDLAMLSAAAVEFRYPGTRASRQVAKQALDTCERVRQEMRQMI